MELRPIVMNYIKLRNWSRFILNVWLEFSLHNDLDTEVEVFLRELVFMLVWLQYVVACVCGERIDVGWDSNHCLVHADP